MRRKIVNEFEKLNKRKAAYRTIDDDTISHLKTYYKLENLGELLKFVKDAAIVGDEE